MEFSNGVKVRKSDAHYEVTESLPFGAIVKVNPTGVKLKGLILGEYIVKFSKYKLFLFSGELIEKKFRGSLIVHFKKGSEYFTLRNAQACIDLLYILMPMMLSPTNVG